MKRLNLKRRAKGITDYKKRLGLLKSGSTRLVVRKTANNIMVQLVDYKVDGDSVLLTVDLSNLKKQGWKGGANTPAAYLLGFLLGKSAKKKKVTHAILDTGRHPKSTKMFAVVKGAVDAGMTIPHGEDVFPSEERIRGEHIVAYMAESKGHQFAKYKKDEVEIDKNFELVLSKLRGA
ncbi:MAG: 50S ribosomal protein L18 [Candidatus Altiarchaeota archaeon]|nr:50S ribosomal protein L18 [Candidatus Altiarchaeota archaeon]